MIEPEVINVLEALREDSTKVRRAASDLYRAMLEFDGGIDSDGQVVKGVRSDYQEAHDRALIEMEEDYLGREQRLPAVDIRTARVVRRVRSEEPALYARYLALDAQVTLLKQVISNRKASIGAYQSILKGERE